MDPNSAGEVEDTDNKDEDMVVSIDMNQARWLLNLDRFSLGELLDTLVEVCVCVVCVLRGEGLCCLCVYSRACSYFEYVRAVGLIVIHV